MSRKKQKLTAKPKTKQAKTKHPAKFIGLTTVESMEKDFRNTPAKLILHCRKNLSQLKQHEKKLKAQLSKATASKKVAKTKHAALTTKMTPAAKKQMIVAKKTCDSWDKATAQLTAEIDHIKAICKSLVQKQTKYTAISKQLAQFEKDFFADSQKKTVAKKKIKKADTNSRSKIVIEPASQAHDEHAVTLTNTEESVEVTA